MLNTKLRHSCILDYDLYRKNIDLVENRRMPTILAHAAEPKPKVNFSGVIKMCPCPLLLLSLSSTSLSATVHIFIFFSRTTGPNSTKHPCVKGIQVCSNEWPRPFPGEIIAKKH